MRRTFLAPRPARNNDENAPNGRTYLGRLLGRTIGSLGRPAPSRLRRSPLFRLHVLPEHRSREELNRRRQIARNEIRRLPCQGSTLTAIPTGSRRPAAPTPANSPIGSLYRRSSGSRRWGDLPTLPQVSRAFRMHPRHPQRPCPFRAHTNPSHGPKNRALRP